MRLLLSLILANLIVATPLFAEQVTYKAAKVVYDVSTADAGELEHLLDRASLLQKIYGDNPFDASIVFVIHEGAIPLFTRANQQRYPQLVRRVNSLTMGEIIQFRLCAASARMQGFERDDFPAFITLVPMADAELIALQNTGYAYLR